jgi:hypothetical protein
MLINIINNNNIFRKKNNSKNPDQDQSYKSISNTVKYLEDWR